ncbi:hypothetical protein CSKR_111937 [Clonorchis sinensis]|uniref:SOCS box domain-containing protein n=1 Tax=Clonorchis sinensis TaxID=79923 RepID=A0A419PQ94_CLOSI|nr:hypothetical protein CSKR_111937 [Clonorchis sinensis]
MAVCGLLDCIDKLLSPVQQAEEAIKEDQMEKLNDLLTVCDEHGNHLINESTLVNAQAKETLLHFAVHQEAARCVALVCNQPYCWDADRPNLIGRSPLNLAESRGYLPVWYPLAVNSQSNKPTVPLPGFGEKTSRSVAAFLIYPHVFVQKPLDWSVDVFTPSNQLGPSIALYTKELSATNLALFFELYRASPEALHIEEGSKSSPLLPLCANRSHLNDCTTYPDCLGNFESTAEDPSSRFRQLHAVWAAHRIQYTEAFSSVRHSSASSVAPDLHGPLSLMDSSRLLIRRLLVNRLVELSTSNTTAHGLNYPKFVSRLGLPSRLQALLAFRDLWPAFQRHRVPRPRSVAHHEVFALDPWFPIRNFT